MQDAMLLWLDEVLYRVDGEGIVALLFNLYDDGDARWSLECVGTSSFDPDSDYWGCDEVDNFGTREKPFAWIDAKPWVEVEVDVKNLLEDYLVSGQHADKLTEYTAVALGFVGGDLTILYRK